MWLCLISQAKCEICTSTLSRLQRILGMKKECGKDLDRYMLFLYARHTKIIYQDNPLIRTSKREERSTASRESASRRTMNALNPPESACEEQAGVSPLPEERFFDRIKRCSVLRQSIKKVVPRANDSSFERAGFFIGF